MATALDISLRQYQRIETGESDLGINRIVAISKVLEVKPTDILGVDDRFIIKDCTNNTAVGQHFTVNQVAEMDLIRELYDKLLAQKDAQIAELRELLKQRRKDNLQ